MKALLPATRTSNAKNLSRDKETVSTYTVVAIVKGVFLTPVTCRCYMGRSASSSTVYASIWIHGNNNEASGHGTAGGYGYHKESAAIASAIRSAGVSLMGSQYADSKGMVLTSIDNPEYSEAARDAAYAESDEAGKRYSWTVPRTLSVMKRENLKQQADIAGVGDSAIEAALLAIAKAVYPQRGAKFSLVKG